MHRHVESLLVVPRVVAPAGPRAASRLLSARSTHPHPATSSGSLVRRFRPDPPSKQVPAGCSSPISATTPASPCTEAAGPPQRLQVAYVVRVVRAQVVARAARASPARAAWTSTRRSFGVPLLSSSRCSLTSATAARAPCRTSPNCSRVPCCAMRAGQKMSVAPPRLPLLPRRLPPLLQSQWEPSLKLASIAASFQLTQTVQPRAWLTSWLQCAARRCCLHAARRIALSTLARPRSACLGVRRASSHQKAEGNGKTGNMSRMAKMGSVGNWRVR